MMIRFGRGTDGYLLVEMLIALSVIAIMAALMSRFLGQLGSISRIESEITAQGELEAAASYMERTLEAARPIRQLSAKPEENPFLIGTSNSIKFSAVTRQGLRSLALRDIHIYLEQTNSGFALVHRITPRRIGNGNPAEELQPITILENVSGLSFDYGFGLGDNASWEKTGELPDTISFRIERQLNGRTISRTGFSVLTGGN